MRDRLESMGVSTVLMKSKTKYFVKKSRSMVTLEELVILFQNDTKLYLDVSDFSFLTCLNTSNDAKWTFPSVFVSHSDRQQVDRIFRYLLTKIKIRSTLQRTRIIEKNHFWTRLNRKSSMKRICFNISSSSQHIELVFGLI